VYTEVPVHPVVIAGLQNAVLVVPLYQETPHRVLVALAVKLNAMLGLTAANATELVILNRPTRFPGDKGIWVPFPAPGAAVLAIRIWDMLDDVFIVVCN
jgi:hypothetical protein